MLLPCCQKAAQHTKLAETYSCFGPWPCWLTSSLVEVRNWWQLQLVLCLHCFLECYPAAFSVHSCRLLQLLGQRSPALPELFPQEIPSLSQPLLLSRVCDHPQSSAPFALTVGPLWAVAASTEVSL